MSNMTIGDRNQIERASLSRGTGVRVNGLGRRLLSAYSVIAAGVLGALLVGAAQVYDGWHHALVIGVGLITFYGLCRWVYPDRKHI